MIRCVLSKLLEQLDLKVQVLSRSLNHEVDFVQTADGVSEGDSSQHIFLVLLCHSLLADFLVAPFCDCALTKLKLLLADKMLEVEAMKDVLSKLRVIRSAASSQRTVQSEAIRSQRQTC